MRFPITNITKTTTAVGTMHNLLLDWSIQRPDLYQASSTLQDFVTMHSLRLDRPICPTSAQINITVMQEWEGPDIGTPDEVSQSLEDIMLLCSPKLL